MAIGLIAWGRFLTNNGQKITVPAPVDGTGKPWLWDFLRAEAKNIGQHFDYVQLPPWSLTQSKTAATGDGYGVAERRNLDGTRYGNTQSLIAAIAALNAHGCRTLGDLVFHQFATMTKKYPNNRRGAQTEGWFRGHTSWNATTNTWNDPIPPYCEEDNVPVPVDDFAFGKEISHQHCNPPNVTTQDEIDYLQYVSDLTGAVGYRYDDTKGTYAPAVKRVMDSRPDTFFYSEYFDGNPSDLNWWATSSPMNSRSAVEDFTLHWRLQAACNNFDATQFDKGGAGYWQWNSGLSVGFVDNPDTDTSAGQQIVSNKGIAYALMLNLPLRLALVYGKDYYPDAVWPGAYGLKPVIDNLCWIARMFAFGAFRRVWVDCDIYAYTRDGNGGSDGWSGGLLVAANFNTQVQRTIKVQTTFGPNRWIHDYTGHCADVSTDGNGYATITIPANTNASGKSFACYAPGGVEGTPKVVDRYTTQTFTAASDLFIPSATNTIQALPYKLFIAKGSGVALSLALEPVVALEVNQSLAAVLETSDGKAISFVRLGANDKNTRGVVPEDGEYTLAVQGTNLTQPLDYVLSVTYNGLAG